MTNNGQGEISETTTDIARLVQQDIEARAQLGERKYGGRLSVGSRNNMTSPLQNAYEEALDLAIYLRQEIEERSRDDRRKWFV